MDLEKIKLLKEKANLRLKEIEYYEERIKQHEELLEFSKREYFKELERVKRALNS